MFPRIQNETHDHTLALIFVTVSLLKTLKFYRGKHSQLDKLHMLDLFIIFKNYSIFFNMHVPLFDIPKNRNHCVIFEKFLLMIRRMRRLLALLVF